MNQQLISDLISFVESANSREADRHYDTYIFKPRHAGDTPAEKYLDEWNSEAKDLLDQLRSLQVEDDEDDDALNAANDSSDLVISNSQAA